MFCIFSVFWISVSLSLVVLSRLEQQHRENVGQDAMLCDGDFSQQLVELLVSKEGRWRVARQLQDLGSS